MNLASPSRHAKYSIQVRRFSEPCRNQTLAKRRRGEADSVIASGDRGPVVRLRLLAILLPAPAGRSLQHLRLHGHSSKGEAIQHNNFLG